MNASIRRLSLLVLLMFLALMGAATWIQYAEADSLNADARNLRTLYREYGTYRGPIVVDGVAIAYSVPVDDYFGYQRVYTNGPMYAHLTGYYSVVYGRSGIEAAENTLLSGSDDALFWSRFGDLLSGEEQQGASVELTIRSALQEVAYEALGSQRGAVIALDPRTGEILAMVSSPTYDPALLASHNTALVNENWERLIALPDQPLANRVIAGDTYAPGSVFKLITAAAALEAGYSPETLVYAPAELTLPLTDATIQNYGGEECDVTENTTLLTAFARSCNTAFANIGLTLEWGPLARTAEGFGWGRDLAIPLAVTPSRLPVNPDEPQTAISAIGQFDVRTTPLQMAMVASAIANDGVLMTPYLVSTVRDPSLRVVESTTPHVYSTPLSVAASRDLRDMMTEVVENGTGVAAQIPGVSVAGKTGTAEAGGGASPHAWFVGFAPANNPVIVVVVVVENGGSLGDEATGGRVAAPIARAVIQQALVLEDEREGAAP